MGWSLIFGFGVEHVGARLIILGGGDGDGRADSLVTFGSNSTSDELSIFPSAGSQMLYRLLGKKGWPPS